MEAGESRDHRARDERGRSEGGTSVSVIVPTYREVENIPLLVERVESVARQSGLDLELLIVDDASDDGTPEAVTSMAKGDWLRLVRRSGERSLSGAVLDGLKLARSENLVVMDADLSHPPEAIPSLVAPLQEGTADFVIGSRFVAGGSIDQSWSALRRLNSWAARVLARPVTAVADPTSGFFALRRESFLSADPIDPIGYKIGLELLVKCGCSRVREVPIHFQDRQQGLTKLGWRQQVEYLEHLRRLIAYRWRNRPPS
jgi:dolichol-phosphate mannosyltransferase